MNISSIVVQTSPKFLDSVLNALKESDFCDYHFHDELGRIIVTVEGDGVGQEIEKLVKIQEVPHVIAADMQFAYSEEELDEERDKLVLAKDDVPSMLNDDSVGPRDIVYNGDINNFFQKK